MNVPLSLPVNAVRALQARLPSAHFLLQNKALGTQVSQQNESN